MSRTSLAALWGAVITVSVAAGAQNQPVAVPSGAPAVSAAPGVSSTVSAASVASPSGARPAVAPHAEPVRMRLAWVRGEGAERCPDAAAIERAVATRLDRAPFAAEASQSIESLVRRDGPRWSAQIYLRDHDGALLGERALGSDAVECAALLAPVSLAIALAIDPEAALRPLADPAAPPAAPPVAPPARPPTRPRPARLRTSVTPGTEVALWLGAWGTAGILPGLTPGVSFGASARIAGRLGAFAATGWLPERPLDPQANPTRFGLSSVMFGPELALWSHPRARVVAVTGLGVGAVHAVVFSPAPAEPGARGFASWLIGARGSADLWGPLGVALGLEAWVPITRYLYRDPERTRDPVFEQSVVGGSVWLALSARFR